MLSMGLKKKKKIGMILVNKMVQKLKLSKNDFDKTCAPKLLLFIEKKIRKIDS